MLNIYFTSLLVCLALFQSTAQSGFNKIVDTANPITTFTSPGIYKGASWVDFDNDGDIDLFAAPDFLFRNDGANGFVQLNMPFGFTPLQNPGGSSWADLDNDGWLDCIIAQYPSGVYLNDNFGGFINITSQISGLTNFPSWGCAIGDWNKDAFPDFVFAHAANFHPIGPFPSKLYLSTNASLNPSPVFGNILTDSVKPFTVPYWSDFDLDGDMDLFVASGPGGVSGPDFCYRNLKMETGFDSLELITNTLFSTQLQDGQCYNFIDFDNDRDLDLCLTNYSGAPTRFYKNDGGTYSELVLPFSNQTSNLANDWADFDNDGDLDLIITNDQVPAKLFWNMGNGGFSPPVSLGVLGACGATNGDFDNDGDLDMFLNGAANARALFRNDSAAVGNNWINIKCNGTMSNKSAIGAIIKAKAMINGMPVWQLREINAQNSFQSQNDLRVHFGLGNATFIDSLLIQYPSGIVEVVTNVAANFFYCNDEGSGSLCVITSFTELTESNLELSVNPNPAFDFIDVTIPECLVGKLFQINIVDSKGTLAKIVNYENENDTVKIPISELIVGVYFIKIKNDNKSFAARLVKL